MDDSFSVLQNGSMSVNALKMEGSRYPGNGNQINIIIKELTGSVVAVEYPPHNLGW